MDEESIPKAPTNPVTEQQIADACAVLYQIVNAPDPDTGEITPQKGETQLYRNYLDNQAAYIEARRAYSDAYLKAQKTVLGRNTWPMVAPTFQLSVTRAYEKWRAGDADKIEQALAILTTSSTTVIGDLKEEAREQEKE